MYEQNIDYCFEENVNSNGLNRVDFDKNLYKADKIANQLKHEKEFNNSPIFNHIGQSEDIAEIIKIGEEIKNNFNKLIVVGTGGSTLTPQSVVSLAQPDDSINKKVHFIDSVDSYDVEYLINEIDLENTAFLITSKSGRTIETITLFLSFLDALETSNLNAGKHIYIISDNIPSPLREIGKKIGATILDHVKEIGGRFSTFTNVGLIPAYVAGVDIIKIRDYAKKASDSFFKCNSIPVQGAALQYSFMQKGTPITVMMPYVNRLSSFATWYRQVWAESLGKNGKGSTPIKAIGSLDQHSQLQLYLDGPKDKLFNLISCDTTNDGKKINNDYLNNDIAYLKNKHIGDVNASLQDATAKTLIEHNCPLRHIKIGEMNEESLSKIIVHFMLETIITANLLGLNPFGQPAVEHGKRLTLETLGA